MTQSEIVYDYLKNQYSPNEPIFLSDIDIPEVKAVSVRQQLKKLVEDGRVKRFDTGVYYLPMESVFRSGSTLSVDDVIRKKYLQDGDKCCGFVSGVMFANRIGITTQVPAIYEITTNKATTDYRETKLGNIRIIIRKPYVEVSDDNVHVLQFLDLMKEVVDVSEIEGSDLTKRLTAYMKRIGIDFDMLKPYLSSYPERIYRNMYEVGLLNGIST